MPINDKKEITVEIDEELYAEILQYLTENGMDMTGFVEQALQHEIESKEKMNMKTIAFQVPEDLYNRFHEFIVRNNLVQKHYLSGVIEDILKRDLEERERASETQEDVSAAQEENAPVDNFENNSEESENTVEATAENDFETVSEEVEEYTEEPEDTDIGETEDFNATEDEEQPEAVAENDSEMVSEEAEEYTEGQEDTDIGETEAFNAAEDEEQPETVVEDGSESVSEETEEYTEKQEDADIGETEDFDVAEDNDTEALPENNEDENMAANAEYPYIRAVWTADGQLADCALENSTENIASFILRHKDDGEISFRTPDDAEVMTASGGAVMTASDTDYLDNELNPALTKLSSRRRLPKIKEVDYGEEPEYTADDLEEETSESEDEEAAPVMAM